MSPDTDGTNGHIAFDNDAPESGKLQPNGYICRKITAVEKDFIKYVDIGLRDVPVMAGSQTMLSRLARETDGYGLKGIEMFKGYEITVAEAVRSNVCADGVSFGDVISGVVCHDTTDGKKVKFTAAECRFTPSSSLFLEEERYVISSILIRLERDLGGK